MMTMTRLLARLAARDAGRLLVVALVKMTRHTGPKAEVVDLRSANEKTATRLRPRQRRRVARVLQLRRLQLQLLQLLLLDRLLLAEA
jgi:hypothetical protein